jgi:hypothetical protein
MRSPSPAALDRSDAVLEVTVRWNDALVHAAFVSDEGFSLVSEGASPTRFVAGPEALGPRAEREVLTRDGRFVFDRDARGALWIDGEALSLDACRARGLARDAGAGRWSVELSWHRVAELRAGPLLVRARRVSAGPVAPRGARLDPVLSTVSAAALALFFAGMAWTRVASARDGTLLASRQRAERMATLRSLLALQAPSDPALDGRAHGPAQRSEPRAPRAFWQRNEWGIFSVLRPWHIDEDVLVEPAPSPLEPTLESTFDALDSREDERPRDGTVETVGTVATIAARAVRGTRSGEQLARQVRLHRYAIERCAERAAEERAGAAHGRLRVLIVVDRDGSVLASQVSEATRAAESAGACVAHALRSVSFAPASDLSLAALSIALSPEVATSGSARGPRPRWSR